MDIPFRAGQYDSPLTKLLHDTFIINARESVHCQGAQPLGTSTKWEYSSIQNFDNFFTFESFCRVEKPRNRNLPFERW
jgi:hypothetical protein